MSEVSDYSALLYYLDDDVFRWNGQTSVGTQVVVTYSFVETQDLAPVSTDPYGASSYWSFSEVQRGYFRQVTEEFEATAGIRFVEVEGPAMVNVFGFNGGSAGGWADIALSQDGHTSQGDLAIGTSALSPGSYGYETMLHELGHSMGLKHPHDGDLTLKESLDNQENTVMTYSYDGYSVTDLGTMDAQALQNIYGDASAFEGWNVGLNRAGKVKIRATGEDDVMVSTDQATVLVGRGGDDQLIGREAKDVMRGGAGQDTLIGGLGNDKLNGGGGSDVLYGGIGEDDYSGGENDSDVLHGRGGHDQIFGGGGDDRLTGARGADTLEGGNGNDRLLGGGGSDILNGGDGDDVLTGGGGADVFVFTDDDFYDVNTITDFTSGVDVIDVSQVDPAYFGEMNAQQDGGDTVLSYGSWFEIRLEGFTGSLTEGDILYL